MYKAIFACQVAAGYILYRLAGIGNKIEHGIPSHLNSMVYNDAV